MLAEVVFKKKFQVPENLGLIDLYDEFIKIKLSIYHREKTDTSVGNVGAAIKDEISSNTLLGAHHELALRIFFKENSLPNLNKLKELVKWAGGEKKARQELARVGLLNLNRNKLEFIHRSFAEYFLSVYLIENLQDGQVQNLLLKYIMLKMDYELIRKFFNGQLKKNTSLGNILKKAIQESIIDTNSSEDIATIAEKIAETLLWRFNEHPGTFHELLLRSQDRTVLEMAIEEGDNRKIIALVKWVRKNIGKCTLEKLVKDGSSFLISENHEVIDCLLINGLEAKVLIPSEIEYLMEEDDSDDCSSFSEDSEEYSESDMDLGDEEMSTFSDNKSEFTSFSKVGHERGEQLLQFRENLKNVQHNIKNSSSQKKICELIDTIEKRISGNEKGFLEKIELYFESAISEEELDEDQKSSLKKISEVIDTIAKRISKIEKPSSEPSELQLECAISEEKLDENQKSSQKRIGELIDNIEKKISKIKTALSEQIKLQVQSAISEDKLDDNQKSSLKKISKLIDTFEKEISKIDKAVSEKIRLQLKFVFSEEKLVEDQNSASNHANFSEDIATIAEEIAETLLWRFNKHPGTFHALLPSSQYTTVLEMAIEDGDNRMIIALVNSVGEIIGKDALKQLVKDGSSFLKSENHEVIDCLLVNGLKTAILIPPEKRYLLEEDNLDFISDDSDDFSSSTTNSSDRSSESESDMGLSDEEIRNKSSFISYMKVGHELRLRLVPFLANLKNVQANIKTSSSQEKISALIDTIEERISENVKTLSENIKLQLESAISEKKLDKDIKSSLKKISEFLDTIEKNITKIEKALPEYIELQLKSAISKEKLDEDQKIALNQSSEGSNDYSPDADSYLSETY
ncbi:hypothetical protein HHI36_012545 [Cryptolaemus montrouzieri]|uniref:Ankyrin repeat protein n=1 Tax=Cryptolaemus montrouzieri TaxID=559131 RepID=A0ABD2NF63_9CUCU